MNRYLTAAIWPVGLLIIFGAAYFAWRRSLVTSAVSADRAGPRARRHQGHRAGTRSSSPDAVVGSGRLAVIAALGAVAVFGVMCLLGLLVVNHGAAIDKPVFTWIQNHPVHPVVAAMKRLTKIGDTWTTWGAAIAAAVCLAVTWRDKRWVPPVALVSLIVVDHYTTLALRHVFHRPGPPTSPLGTYPSGGCDRAIVFYGLIAYLLWREFSGRRPTAIWAGAVVAALGFSEAFSRVYLSLHWLTDTLSGLLYGGLLLAGYILAIRVAAGRPVAPRADQESAAVPVAVAPTEGPAT
jgi:membrane-associated phospholipid phosphatase